MLQGTNNAARKVIDGFHYIADSITSVGSKPTKMISDWMNDRIAPEYWVPNSQISVSLPPCKISFIDKSMLYSIIFQSWKKVCSYIVHVLHKTFNLIHINNFTILNSQ